MLSAASPQSTLAATWAFSLTCLFQKCVLQIEPHMGIAILLPSWMTVLFVFQLNILFSFSREGFAV